MGEKIKLAAGVADFSLAAMQKSPETLKFCQALLSYYLRVK